ncbi:MAG: ribonuclease P protein component [Pseudomonadota bacterium]
MSIIALDSNTKLISLKNSKAFKAVYKGRKFYTAAFSVHFLVPAHGKDSVNSGVISDEIYFGITVSKKSCGHAVRRNKIKRCIREAFRQFGAKPALNGYQIVFTALRRAPEKNWDDYRKAMQYLPKLIKRCENENSSKMDR